MARRPSPSRLSPAVRDADPAAGGVGRSAPLGLVSGALGFGSGGPLWLDAFRTKPAPQPWELVNAYKSIAFACVGLNAKGVAKVPLRLYAVKRPGQHAPRRSHRTAPDHVQRLMRGLVPGRAAPDLGLARAIDSNDEVDEVLDHPLLEALQKPNPYFDREILVQYLVACLDVVGAAYLFPERPPGADGTGDPTWASRVVWPLQPQYVYPVKGSGDRLLDGWRYFGDTFAPHEMVRTRWVSLRDPYLSQYSPMHACFEQTSLVDFYTASIEGILSGGARPDVIIGPKDNLNRWGGDERERFEDDVNRQFGRTRKGRAWVVDGAFDVHTLSYPPTDLGGLELTKEQRLLAANCFDVPISLLQNENSNRATAQESTHQHQYYAIDPRCRLIAATLTAQWAQPVDDRLFWFFDDPVARDVEQDARVWKMKVESGHATPNEWRANDGLPPVDGGDQLFIANNLVPLAAPAGPGPEAGTDGGTPGGDERPPGPAGVPADDVQGQALNGAQVSSLLEIVQNVRDGVIPPEAAKALIAAAFPALTADQVARIVDPVDVKPAPDPAPAAPPGTGTGPRVGPDGPPAPTPPPAARSAGDDLDGQLARVLTLLEGRLTRADGDPESPGGGGDRGGGGDGGALPE